VYYGKILTQGGRDDDKNLKSRPHGVRIFTQTEKVMYQAALSAVNVL